MGGAKKRDEHRPLPWSADTAQRTTLSSNPRETVQHSTSSDRQEEQSASQAPLDLTDFDNHARTLAVQTPSPFAQANQGIPCPNCDHFFYTEIGLGVHRRHLRKVNADRLESRWSDEELRIMVREKARTKMNRITLSTYISRSTWEEMGRVRHFKVYAQGCYTRNWLRQHWMIFALSLRSQESNVNELDPLEPDGMW